MKHSNSIFATVYCRIAVGLYRMIAYLAFCNEFERARVGRTTSHYTLESVAKLKFK